MKKFSSGFQSVGGEAADMFDMEFLIKELENELSIDLENMLQILKPPITTIVDENNLSLLHHAVLKGVQGRT